MTVKFIEVGPVFSAKPPGIMGRVCMERHAGLQPARPVVRLRDLRESLKCKAQKLKYTHKRYRPMEKLNSGKTQRP